MSSDSRSTSPVSPRARRMLGVVVASLLSLAGCSSDGSSGTVVPSSDTSSPPDTGSTLDVSEPSDTVDGAPGPDGAGDARGADAERADGAALDSRVRPDSSPDTRPRDDSGGQRRDTAPDGVGADAGADASTADAAGRDTGAVDGGGGPTCSNIRTEGGCRQASGCEIWRATCDGKLVVERCIPEKRNPTPPPCQEVSPGQCDTYRTREDCHRAGDACQWLTEVAQSCGGGGNFSTGCYPDVSCGGGATCPTDYMCRRVRYDPCFDPGLSGIGCGPCSAGKLACVPL